MNQFLSYKPSETDIIVGSRKIYTDQLPIRFHKTEIQYAVDQYSCVVIVAETGSGKTTQIPQYLVEAGYAASPYRVCVSLPRRMAAISIASRVSDEFGTQVGDQIGYRVRFESRTGANTKVEFVTDGTLIQLLMSDPMLSLYNVVMVDDVHERTINTDLVLALLKKVRKRRPELKLIISSATIQAEQLATFFQDKQFSSKILHIQGRTFPVDVHYLREPCKNYIVTSAEITAKIHRERRSEGDILTFLTSAEEVHAYLGIVSELLAESSTHAKMLLFPLYANLPLEKQLEIFKQAPPGVRKIIAATNIAESSITIDGIVYVIDCVHQKVKVFDHKKNFDSMRVVPISKQQAQQRAGRAGRTRPGQCFRLCTQADYDIHLPKAFEPEILRSKLNDLVLQLRSFCMLPTILSDPQVFLDAVPIDNLAPALTTLVAQQLLTKNLELTEMGEAVIDYPLDPSMAICVEMSYSEDFQCAEEILKVAAMLSVQGSVFGDAPPLSILKAKKALGCKEGDHLSLCNILTRYQTIGNKGNWCDTHKISKQRLDQADKIFQQLARRKGIRKIKTSVDDAEAVIRCLLTGYFMQVAQREPGSQEGVYRNIFNRELIHLHSGSVLTISYPEWILYHDLVEQQGRLTIRDGTEIHPEWLLEIAPHFFQDVRKQQAEQKHQQEKKVLDDFEEQKKQQDGQKLIDENKVIFGRSKKKFVPQAQKPQTSNDNVFIKPNLPIKNKEDRIGSVRKSVLSFDDDDF